jgi:peroxiredoxin
VRCNVDRARGALNHGSTAEKGEQDVPDPGRRNGPSRLQAAGHPRPVALSRRFEGQTGQAFYPADWSPVCGDQMALYNEVLPEFHKHGAELLGISVDGAWCHEAFAQHRHLHFPLLADFHPKGAVAQSYGVYRETDGVSERALFVLDSKGVIFWSYCSPIAVNPGADGILDALERMPNNRKKSHGHAQGSSHAA